MRAQSHPENPMAERQVQSSLSSSTCVVTPYSNCLMTPPPHLPGEPPIPPAW